MKNECDVLINDVSVFSGTHSECCDYITNRFTPVGYDLFKDYIDIAYHGGRLASYSLEWK